MRLDGQAMRLTILVGETDQWHHRPVYTEIVHRAHATGLAGATVLHGIAGYGFSARIHTSGILSLGDHLPAAIIIVDDERRVRAFLPHLDEVMDGGLVMLEPVEVRRHLPADPARPVAARRRPLRHRRPWGGPREA
jgi:PII-like signaling protein